MLALCLPLLGGRGERKKSPALNHSREKKKGAYLLAVDEKEKKNETVDEVLDLLSEGERNCGEAATGPEGRGQGLHPARGKKGGKQTFLEELSTLRGARVGRGKSLALHPTGGRERSGGSRRAMVFPLQVGEKKRRGSA